MIGSWSRRRPVSGLMSGVTLPEFVVMVVIIGIMAGLSVPLLAPRYRDYQLQTSAWQLAGDLRLARQRAITTRTRYRLAFANSAAAANPDTYVIEVRTDAGPPEVWIQELPRALGTRQPLTGAVHIDPTSTPASGTIAFNVNGSVVPTGTIHLMLGGGQTTVKVDQVGRVTMGGP